MSDGLSQTQFAVYGPMWQAECDVCETMSDCFDSADDRDQWMAHHDCGEKLKYAIPSRARELGWKVVRP